jgi:hypothetical protein
VGLLAHATEARLSLAQCLRLRQRGDDQRRALTLARDAQSAAQQLGHARLISQARELCGE